MNWLYKRFSGQKCTVICGFILLLMFSLEIIAVDFFIKDTVPFNVLMGIVIFCPFVFTFFLQGAWRDSDSSEEWRQKRK